MPQLCEKINRRAPFVPPSSEAEELGLCCQLKSLLLPVSPVKGSRTQHFPGGGGDAARGKSSLLPSTAESRGWEK